MNKKSIIILFLSIALTCLIFIVAVTDPAYMTHEVKKGESVSLLCIEIYGYYSGRLGAAFVKDNPDVKDINLIYVGQKLRFRKPVSDSTEVVKEDKQEEKKDIPVFQKRVNATQGVVTYVEGRADITKKGIDSPEKLQANVVVYPGDIIKTGNDGRVELIINRESVVRMKENTELTIDQFRDLKKQEGKTALNFSLGSVWSKMKKFKDSISRFELETPTAIAGVHGTVYQTTVNKDSSAEVKVYDGEVAVSGVQEKQENPSVQPGVIRAPQEISGPKEIAGPKEVTMEEWTTIVRAMQTIRIDSKGTPSEATSFTRNPDDSWEKWNEARDKRIAQLFGESN